MRRVGVVPQVSGVGGMVSFRGRFTAGLAARGVEVLSGIPTQGGDSLLVIGGTRDIAGLWRAKRAGVRIVQRLNGMNWLHRRKSTGLKHYLRAEYGNGILRFIRARLADHIIYQSEFARTWWEGTYGPAPVPVTVVYNAVDLHTYSPKGDSPAVAGPAGRAYQKPADCYRVLLVEGSLMGGYEMGLETAVELVNRLNVAHRQDIARPVELLVAGRVSPDLKSLWSARSDFSLVWAGLVPAASIPELDRAAHLLYSADLQAACPNAVIEALACGLPVLAFDTGSLPELVRDQAGRVVPYGGDPWKLDRPDIPALAQAAVDIFTHQEPYRAAARARAEAAFGLDRMLDSYLAALLPG